MRHLLAALTFAFTSLSITTALAGERTIKLAVDGLSCPSCYFIVKHSILRVPGVKAVDLFYDDKFEAEVATVTFDDTLASAEAISNATNANGFPSKILAPAS